MSLKLNHKGLSLQIRRERFVLLRSKVYSSFRTRQGLYFRRIGREQGGDLEPVPKLEKRDTPQN